MTPNTLPNAVGGVYPNGNATYPAGARIERGQPVKLSGAAVIPTTDPTDPAIGIALDGAEDGGIIPVAILGAFTGTVLLRAAGAISAGAQIAADATSASSSHVVIGRALEAAAAEGDLINIAHQVGHVL